MGFLLFVVPLFMPKKNNWPTLLAHFIEDRKAVPFEWGKNDCCLFVADAIEHITGNDYAAEYRGTYTTELGAYRSLKKRGDGTVASAWAAHFPEIPVNAMGRGDVALVLVKEEPAVSICFGARLWIVSKQGLITLPRSEAVKAWRVA